MQKIYGSPQNYFLAVGTAPISSNLKLMLMKEVGDHHTAKFSLFFSPPQVKSLVKALRFSLDCITAGLYGWLRKDGWLSWEKYCRDGLTTSPGGSVLLSDRGGLVGQSGLRIYVDKALFPIALRFQVSRGSPLTHYQIHLPEAGVEKLINLLLQALVMEEVNLRGLVS